MLGTLTGADGVVTRIMLDREVISLMLEDITISKDSCVGDREVDKTTELSRTVNGISVPSADSTVGIGVNSVVNSVNRSKD